MVILFLVVIGWSSCGDSAAPTSSNPPATTSPSSNEVANKEYDSKYICPMHCEGSGSNQPGDCPVCHMHYKKNKNYKTPK